MSLAVGAGLGLAGYVIGSVSFARIIGRRVMPGEDLSVTTLELPGGDGATIEYTGVSATSVGARRGPRWGIVTGVADMLKAFAPTLAVRLAYPGHDYYLLVAVAVMTGHIWPVFHRFTGGRGQSPLYGGLLAVDWIAVPVTTALGTIFGLFVARDMFVAYTAGMVLLVPWFAVFGSPARVGYAVAVNALFFVASIPEIRGYLQRRREGSLRQVASWRDLKRSHPAMGAGRFDEEV